MKNRIKISKFTLDNHRYINIYVNDYYRFVMDISDALDFVNQILVTILGNGDTCQKPEIQIPHPIQPDSKYPWAHAQSPVSIPIPMDVMPGLPRKSSKKKPSKRKK